MSNEVRNGTSKGSGGASALQLAATCAFGLETVVARELTDLGAPDVRAENGAVVFGGGPDMLVKANLWLRCADRVWVRLARFKATTFEDLFQGVKSLPWPELLPRDAEFPVEGSSHESQLSSVPACQAVTKKAVVESLKRAYKTDWFEEKGPLFRIRVSLVRDEVTIALDSSGSGLHKRGYRTLTAEAPLRETLAAGLVLLSYWKLDRVLVDPFCGSGTIPIEAALIGLKRAPGLRRAFACEGWPFVGKARWAAARADAEDAFDRVTKLQITGHDNDEEVLRMARHHLRQADLLERGVHFRAQPVREFRSKAEYGVVITNPPYGERLGDQRDAERLYEQLGQVMRPLRTWSVYVLTSHSRFERFYGQSAGKKRKLYNGMIVTWYYPFLGPRPPRTEGDLGLRPDRSPA